MVTRAGFCASNRRPSFVIRYGTEPEVGCSKCARPRDDGVGSTTVHVAPESGGTRPSNAARGYHPFGAAGWCRHRDRKHDAGYQECDQGYAHGGGWLFEILNTPDSVPRLGTVADQDTPKMRAEMAKVVRRRFAGYRVLPQNSGMSDYEQALLVDLDAARRDMSLPRPIGINTWNRALVKIELGLAALTFGPELPPGIEH
jgi:hypothetical protein